MRVDIGSFRTRLARARPGSDGTGQRLGKVTLSKVAFGEAAWDTLGGLDSDTGGFIGGDSSCL